MTEKEKSYAGLLYQPADPELAADRDVTAKKLYEYNQLHPLDREARQAAIREILGKTGKKLRGGAAPFLHLRLQHHRWRQLFSQCQLQAHG